MASVCVSWEDVEEGGVWEGRYVKGRVCEKREVGGIGCVKIHQLQLALICTIGISCYVRLSPGS